jgi:Na+-driven multidrug efflux pump
MYVNLVTLYCILLPGAYVVGVYWGFGYVGLWLVHQIGFRAINSVILATMWQQRKWAEVKFW